MSVQSTLERPQRMTFPEYLEWLDDETHAEWVDGTVVKHGPVTFRENHLCLFLLTMLLAYAEEHCPGEVTFAPFQMKLGPELPSRTPDILFVARENRYRFKEYFLDGPADLVIEVASRESRGRDRGDKFFEYEEAGVREYWLIDLEREQAEFYRLGRNGRYVVDPAYSAGRFNSVVLPGLFLDVEWLWREDRPMLSEIRKLWE